MVANLTGEGLTNAVHFKERYLAAADLAPLHSEQKGLIDFLVLAAAARFVGFGPSTYSFFLKVQSARACSALQVSMPFHGECHQ